MAMPSLPGCIVLPARDDGGAAKRARDEDLQAMSQEADARGRSSSVLERSLALRRRRGPAPAPGSGSPTQDCSCFIAASKADEFGCRCEAAATPDAVNAGSAAEETTEAVDLSCTSYFCGLGLAAFLPPPMETTLVPPAAFVTDLDGGIIILDDAKNDDRVVNDTADEQSCRLVLEEETATPNAVGSGQEETTVVDPYFYFCVTL